MQIIKVVWNHQTGFQTTLDHRRNGKLHPDRYGYARPLLYPVSRAYSCCSGDECNGCLLSPAQDGLYTSLSRVGQRPLSPSQQVVLLAEVRRSSYSWASATSPLIVASTRLLRERVHSSDNHPLLNCLQRAHQAHSIGHVTCPAREYLIFGPVTLDRWRGRILYVFSSLLGISSSTTSCLSSNYSSLSALNRLPVLALGPPLKRVIQRICGFSLTRVEQSVSMNEGSWVGESRILSYKGLLSIIHILICSIRMI